MEPGPRLNLVLGPNGAGKSSVVNAVCIVFGGKLKLLGRNPELGAYVRHGYESGYVEVDIYDPSLQRQVCTLRRKFDLEGRSTYSIDGKKVSTQAVDKLAAKYDVQLDNLSQFMPQEKICEFVNLKPDELLVNTVRALGGTQRLQQYNSLLAFDAEILEDERTLRQHQTAFVALQEDIRSHEAEVRAHEEYEHLKETIAEMERYLPWTIFEQESRKFREVKTALKDKEAEMAAEKQKEAELRAPLRTFEHKRQRAIDVWREAKRAVQEKDGIATNAIGELEAKSTQLEMTRKDIERVDKNLTALKTTLQKRKEAYDSAVQKHEESKRHGSAEQDVAEMEECSREIVSRRTDIQDLDAKRQEIDSDSRTHMQELRSLRDRIAQMSDPYAIRLDALAQSHRRNRGVPMCADWVRRNANLFRDRVYGPLVIEVQCDNEYHARVLNSAVPNWAKGAFIVTNRNDLDTLRREAGRALRGFKPDIITTPLGADGQFDPSEILRPDRAVDERLRSCGVEAVLSDLFRAEPPVRAVLNAQFSLHRVYVASAVADDPDCMNALQNEQGVQVWYSPSSRFQARRSRYDANSVSTSVDALSTDPGLFAGRLDGAEHRRRELDTRCAELLKEQSACDSEMSQLVHNIKELQSSIDQIRARSQAARERKAAREREARTVEVQRNRVHTAEQELSRHGADDKKAQLQQRLAKEEVVCLKLSGAIEQLLRDSISALEKRDLAMTRASYADRELRRETSKFEELNTRYQELEVARNEIKARVSAARQTAKTWRTRAENHLPQNELLENMTKYEQFPSDAEELEQRILEAKARKDTMATGGQGIVEQCRLKEKQAQKLEADIGKLVKSLENRRRSYGRNKDEFFVWLEEHINRMRKRFTDLFKRLDACGDIELSTTDSNRMDQLAIQILVSFDEAAKLRPISASSNSGGEKMATTMLYCFALQSQYATSLAANAGNGQRANGESEDDDDEEDGNSDSGGGGKQESPAFIMVDELNQGLDPDREFRIMKMMLEDAELGSAPQSFVITPKLLLNLPIQEHTATHVIMNGRVDGVLDAAT